MDEDSNNDGGPPVQIGRFSVLGLIGRGGMGAVYACYDEQLDRKVAVKVLQVGAGQDREAAAARLVREGQTLARLSHPNVVTVHEVGQTDQQVYVAMEFIRGASLDAWVSQPRSWREIMAAFLQAGRGLMAAHRAGIVHSDFKPQNVLMNEHGLVKVLDFGLARASGDQVREEWLASQCDGAEPSSAGLTRTGTLIGTPVYMSPEQHRGELATLASDQFSFCVSLYQCLYGVLPFSTRSLAELRKDIMQGRVAPPQPRDPVPVHVFKVLRRGLAVDPADRFLSMDALLTALARDPASIHRRIAALVVTAAVTGATGVALAGTREAVVERCPDARAELAGIWDDSRKATVRTAVQATRSSQASEVLALVGARIQRYADGWTDMRNEACESHASDHQPGSVFDLRTACLDQRRASLDALVGAAATVDAATLERLPQAAAGLPPLERCADAQALLAAIEPPAGADMRGRVQEHRESLARAQVREDAGQYRLGLQLVESVLADAQALTYEPLLAEAYLHRGSIQMESGEPEAADESFDRALEAALAVGHEAVAAQASSKRGFVQAVRLGQTARAELDLPLIVALNRRVQGDIDLYAEFLNNTGVVHLLLGELDLAQRRFTAAQALRRAHGREETLRGLWTLNNLALLALQEGRLEDEETILRGLIRTSETVLGASHFYRVVFETRLALNLNQLGRPRAAHAMIDPLANADRPEHPAIQASVLWTLALIELTEGAAGPARRHLVAALSLTPEVSAAYDELLRLLMRAAAAEGDMTAMQAYHDAALARLEPPLKPGDSRDKWLLLDKGRALTAGGRPHDAIAALEQMMSLLGDDSVSPDGLPGERMVAQAWQALGTAHHEVGEYDAAERELARAHVELQRDWPVLYPEHADIVRELGEVALARGRVDGAVKHLTAAESIYAATAESDYTPLARTRFALSRALTGAAGPMPATARSHAEQALEGFRAKGKTDEVRAVESWLAEHP